MKEWKESGVRRETDTGLLGESFQVLLYSGEERSGGGESGRQRLELCQISKFSGAPIARDTSIRGLSGVVTSCRSRKQRGGSGSAPKIRIEPHRQRVQYTMNQGDRGQERREHPSVQSNCSAVSRFVSGESDGLTFPSFVSRDVSRDVSPSGLDLLRAREEVARSECELPTVRHHLTEAPRGIGYSALNAVYPSFPPLLDFMRLYSI
ncbi:hypothetical protein DFH09DRAFT_1485776 [Mycena vulgaris]|nr:hypothetical protein DFH09DRAFT_1485776 [Mycena vulgaris]